MAGGHFHLLLRTGPTPLSTVMRRLMTGYAVTFNKRHRRSGHLFQNRYKSVICEEDPYLLELIRYIHLNPLRAGLVNDLKELDKYPWSGHSVLIGKQKNPLIPETQASDSTSADLLASPESKGWRAGGGLSFSLSSPPASPEREQWRAGGKGKKQKQYPAKLAVAKLQAKPCPVNPAKNKSLAEKTAEDVLLFFGKNLKEARRRYRVFVKKGIKHGRREDLQGGGLVRSAGGDKAVLLGQKKEECDPPASPERAQARDGGRGKGDARILGSGDFVVQALKRANELHERSIKPLISLKQLIKRVSKDKNIDLKDLISSKRKKDISNARAIISYLAAIELRHSGAKIALELKLSEKSVSRCIERGKKLVDNNKELLEYLQ